MKGTACYYLSSKSALTLSKSDFFQGFWPRTECYFFFTLSFSAYRPFNTNFSTNLTNAALLNETFYLVCSAEANPAAEFRYYKKDESLANIPAGSQNISLFPTSVNERVKEVTYKCIPFNSFGDGPTKTITVTVHCKYAAICSWLLCGLIVFLYTCVKLSSENPS